MEDLVHGNRSIRLQIKRGLKANLLNIISITKVTRIKKINGSLEFSSTLSP